MNKALSILSFFGILLITACGGGGSGGGDENSTPTWGGPVNSSGYPEVAGLYSFKTGSISVSCTDGSSDTLSAIAFNITVTQTDNKISFQSDAGDTPGITITETSGTSGNIETDASFIVTQTSTATVDGIAGNITLNYNLSGAFSTSGHSGTYKYSAYFQSYYITCTYTTSFSGSKLSKPLAKLSPDINAVDENHHKAGLVFGYAFKQRFGIDG